MMEFTNRMLWDAATAAGMHRLVRVARPGGSGVVQEVWVNWSEPDDIDPLRGTQSKRYEMEYMREDLPDLTKGDVVSVDEPDGAVDFYVRQQPFVDERHGLDGTFKVAVLTRVVGRN